MVERGARTVDDGGTCRRCGIPDVHCMCPDVRALVIWFAEADRGIRLVPVPNEGGVSYYPIDRPPDV